MENKNTRIQLFSIGIAVLLLAFLPFKISYFIIILFIVRIAIFVCPTKGGKTPSFETSQEALLVVDMQEALCGKDGIYPGKEALIDRVNEMIGQAKQQGKKVIYVCQEFRSWDFIFCFLILGGRLLEGTGGTSLCTDLNASGDATFMKHKEDGFSCVALQRYLMDCKIDKISVVGVDATACVLKTALGAANRNYQVTVLKDGILSGNQRATNGVLKKLMKRGIAVS
ncbi:MAG: isochorismatase family cysteine hydrolase [Anaerovorax sp.]